MDFAFTFKGLPNDQCTASHVGYMIKGAVTIRMADGSTRAGGGSCRVPLRG